MARTVAKYQLVVEWIQQNIRQGNLAAGDRLESENEIGVRFGISRQTVRHALSILEMDGIIESRQGSGNYVKQQVQAPEAAVRSKTVVIVSTYVNAYIFPNIIQGMERVLEKAGWKIRIMFTHNQFETERKILDRLLQDNDIDGLIIEPTRSGLPNPNLDYYKSLRDKEIPIVFFHSYYLDMDIPHISLDDIMAGYVAAKYLLDRGHQKISGIFKLDDGQGHRRYGGYVKALVEAGIKIRDRRVIWIDTEEESDMDIIREKILKRLRNSTACVCYNDTVANHLMQLCADEDIRIPEDLSIVSVDNSELAKLGMVPLTSVIHPMEALGEKTAQNLLELMKNPSFDANYEFDAEIEIRNSVITIQR